MRRVFYWMIAFMAVANMVACQKGNVKENSQGTAKDSDAYYLQLSAQNNEFYKAYAVDSFVQTSERIHQYLLHHQDRKNKEIQQLRAEWLKARGVYFAALAGRPDSAIVYTDKAIRLMEQERMNPEVRVFTMLNKAEFYRQTGQFDLSAEGYMQALAVADSFQTSEDSRIAINLGISTVFTFMADYTNSGKWWKRCEQLLPQMKEPDQFIYYNNLGNDFFLQDKYREALPCFEKAAAIVRDNPDKTWDYYTARTNIAEILICQKEADKARPILAEVDSFFHKVNFSILLYYIVTSKIELATLEGRTADAIRMIQQNKTPEEMIPAAKVMRLKAAEQAWRQAGNYQEAYLADKQMHAINDSIQTANIKMQMSTRLLEYEHDKKLMEQQQQIEQGKMTSRLAWALFSLALLSVILLTTLYLLHRRKGRLQALELKQQLIETRLRNTRNQLSPHFIYNALNHEMLTQMEGKPVNFESLTQLLRRGLAIADTLHTTLQEELAFIDYYVTVEGKQLGEDFRYERQIDDSIDTSNVKLPAMTIQVFVENAIKHGLRPMAPQEGIFRKLTIHATRQDHAVLVEVLDNGKGLEQGRMKQEHTGMRVVRQTIQMLNEHNAVPIQYGIGNYQQEGDSGCRSWILLPDDYNYTI